MVFGADLSGFLDVVGLEGLLLDEILACFLLARPAACLRLIVVGWRGVVRAIRSE